MSLLDDIQAMRAAATEALGNVQVADALEAWRIKYLGAKGLVKSTMQRLREVSREDKPAAGQAANQLKVALTEAFEAHKSKLGALGGKTKKTAAKLDVTLPGNRPKIGHAHIISQTVSEICEGCN